MAGLSTEQYQNLMGEYRKAEANGDEDRMGRIKSLLQRAGPPGAGAPAVTNSDIAVGESVAHGVGQGFTFGTSDEIYGAGRALFGDGDFSEDYEKFRDEYRGTLASSREQNPWATGIGEAIGGVGSGLLTGGAGLAGAGARGAIAAGAAAGGVTGLGYSEAEDAAGLAKDAAIGAGTGAVFGGAASGVGKGFDYLARRMSPERQVAHTMDKLVQASGKTYKQINEQLREFPEMVLADTDDSFRALLAEVGGPEEFAKISERSMGTWERLVDGFREDASVAGKSIIGQLKGEADRIKELAGIQYEHAYLQVLSEDAQKRIGRQMQGDFYDAAVKHATKLWRRAHPGHEAPRDSFDVKWLDFIQRGMSDLVAKSKKTPQLQKYNRDLHKQFVGVLEDEIDAFKEARALWRGKNANEEAVLKGAQFFSKKFLDDPLEMDWFKGASHDEKIGFKIGMAHALENRLTGKRPLTDLARDLRELPKLRRAMSDVLGDDKYKLFEQRLNIEKDRFETFRLLENFKVGEAIPTRSDDVKNIIWTHVAGLGFGTVDGLALMTANRAALNNARRRFSQGSIRRAETISRLLSNDMLLRPQAYSNSPFAAGAGAGVGAVAAQQTAEDRY